MARRREWENQDMYTVLAGNRHGLTLIGTYIFFLFFFRINYSEIEIEIVYYIICSA